MIEISPIYGRSESKYTFKIVIAFSLTGSDEKFYIPTPKVKAHYNYIEWYAYFDGTHGSSTELHYYANINDDIRIQGNELDFTLQLWRVDRYWGLIKKWDKKLVDSIETYYIDDVGDSRFLYAYDGDSSTKVKVKTIGVEKANTIAIYETNGTVFNGHYQEQERMNVIQLYVNDSGSGTPFEEGLNTIVIPTSLFTETVFNARVQNETLSETPIYSDDEEIFKFISVGRDGNTEQACEEIDFIIIRFDISSADALEVLNLLLECLVNETTNETAIVYSYISTKENGTAAVLMNLPFSVLGLIPWFCDFSDSPMGSKPETFEDWLWKPLKTIGMAIIGVIVIIGMAIIMLVGLIIEFVADILMELLPIFEYVLWLIIRTLLLIFIWIIFALSFIIVSVVLAGIATISITFKLLLNLEVSYGLILGMKYIKFYNFHVPSIQLYIESNDASFEFKFYFFSVNFEFTKFPENIWNNISSSGTLKSSSINPKMSNSNDNTLWEFLDGLGDTMGLAGGFYSAYAIIKGLVRKSGYSNIFDILQMIIWVVSIGAFIGATAQDSEEESNIEMGYSCLGMFLGFFLSGAIVFITSLIGGVSELTLITPEKYWLLYFVLDKLDAEFDSFGLLFDFLDIINLDLPVGYEAPFSLFSGSISLIAGISLVMMFSVPTKDEPGGKWPGFWLGLISMCTSVIFLVASIIYFVSGD